MNFYLGVLVGSVGISLLWVLYIAFFIEDATHLGKRLKKWLQTKLKFPWW